MPSKSMSQKSNDYFKEKYPYIRAGTLETMRINPISVGLIFDYFLWGGDNRKNCPMNFLVGVGTRLAPACLRFS